jgi:hypothetical protein
MNWKTDLRLSDLDGVSQIEIVCRKCGLTRVKTQADMIADQPDLFRLYLDQVEGRLRCGDRFCKASVRISLLWEHKVEGWVGGMP